MKLPAASIAIINARIWTANPDQPWCEAVAVRSREIVATGSYHDLKSLITDSTRVLDAHGRLVLPGFIDAHLHFMAGGYQLTSLQLRDVSSRQEFVSRIQEFARTLRPGVWITGGDWDHTLWGGELPQARWINSVTPGNPVWISRLDGHMALANQAAMDLAGITRRTPDIQGGTIVRYADGAPTGIFKDNALGLIESLIPDPLEAEQDAALDTAMEYVLRQGVTSLQHMGNWEDLSIFKRAHDQHRLKTRIFAAVQLSDWRELQRRIRAEGSGDSWLRIGGLKGFMDGSLGSHTAAFFEPYTDNPADLGLIVMDPGEMQALVQSADKLELQVMIHAIGDRAIHMLLDIYEQVSLQNGARDRRWRIEHAQHPAPADISRFHKLGVIASMQPYHCIDDGRWAEPVIGERRCRTTYAFRSLLDQQAVLAFGSDWSVAPPTPLEGIYAAVTRRTLDGRNHDGWVPEQKISVEEALKCYTINAAYATFEESLKGSITPGKLADMVLVDRNIFTCDPEEIRTTQVLLTMVDGRVLYRNPETGW